MAGVGTLATLIFGAEGILTLNLGADDNEGSLKFGKDGFLPLPPYPEP